MLSGKYVSINRVVERVYKSGLNCDGIDFYDIIEYVGEAIALIGVPYAFEEKIGTVTIADYRGTLPTDLVDLQTARDYDTKVSLLTITSSFHPEYQKSNLASGTLEMAGYYLQGGYMFTNFEEGTVEIAYTAFKTDGNGYPQIPDEERFIKAVLAYALYQIASRLYLQDKLAEKKFRMLETDWYFYVNSAKTVSHIPNLDQAESLKNQLQRFIRPSFRHSGQMGQLNRPEITNI